MRDNSGIPIFLWLLYPEHYLGCLEAYTIAPMHSIVRRLYAKKRLITFV